MTTPTELEEYSTKLLRVANSISSKINYTDPTESRRMVQKIKTLRGYAKKCQTTANMISHLRTQNNKKFTEKEIMELFRVKAERIAGDVVSFLIGQENTDGV